jgi:hypothetical protein
MDSKGFSVAFSNIHFYFVNEFAADIYDQAVDTFMALLNRMSKRIHAVAR